MNKKDDALSKQDLNAFCEECLEDKSFCDECHNYYCDECVDHFKMVLRSRGEKISSLSQCVYHKML